jgi:hypothetical protein
MPSNKRIILYYNELCGKCRDISKFVVITSLKSITRIPLGEWDAITAFYENHPKAKGYPVLFIKEKPIYGGWVFLCVPFAIVLGWWYHLQNLLCSKKNSLSQNDA